MLKKEKGLKSPPIRKEKEGLKSPPTPWLPFEVTKAVDNLTKLFYFIWFPLIIFEWNTRRPVKQREYRQYFEKIAGLPPVIIRKTQKRKLAMDINKYGKLDIEFYDQAKTLIDFNFTISVKLSRVANSVSTFETLTLFQVACSVFRTGVLSFSKNRLILTIKDRKKIQERVLPFLEHYCFYWSFINLRKLKKESTSNYENCPKINGCIIFTETQYVSFYSLFWVFSGTYYSLLVELPLFQLFNSYNWNKAEIKDEDFHVIIFLLKKLLVSCFTDETTLPLLGKMHVDKYLYNLFMLPLTHLLRKRDDLTLDQIFKKFIKLVKLLSDELFHPDGYFTKGCNISNCFLLPGLPSKVSKNIFLYSGLPLPHIVPNYLRIKKNLEIVVANQSILRPEQKKIIREFRSIAPTFRRKGVSILFRNITIENRRIDFLTNLYVEFSCLSDKLAQLNEQLVKSKTNDYTSLSSEFLYLLEKCFGISRSAKILVHNRLKEQEIYRNVCVARIVIMFHPIWLKQLTMVEQYNSYIETDPLLTGFLRANSKFPDLSIFSTENLKIYKKFIESIEIVLTFHLVLNEIKWGNPEDSQTYISLFNEYYGKLVFQKKKEREGGIPPFQGGG